MAEIVRYAGPVSHPAEDARRGRPSQWGPCPICGRPVIEGKRALGCSGWREGCPFVLDREQDGGRSDRPAEVRRPPPAPGPLPRFGATRAARASSSSSTPVGVVAIPLPAGEPRRDFRPGAKPSGREPRSRPKGGAKAKPAGGPNAGATSTLRAPIAPPPRSQSDQRLPNSKKPVRSGPESGRTDRGWARSRRAAKPVARRVRRGCAWGPARSAAVRWSSRTKAYGVRQLEVGLQVQDLEDDRRQENHDPIRASLAQEGSKPQT